MIEITTGSIEEQIIKILQKTYPITIKDVYNKLQLPLKIIMRVLKKLEVKGIIRLEPLSDKTYIRLLRQDFSFVGKRRQKKFIKHHSRRKKQQREEYDGIMYS